jgi:hypothetical protein
MKAKSIYIAISIALLSMTFVSCNEETLYDGPCKVRFVAEVQDEVNVTRATDGYTSFTPSAGFNAKLFVSYETTTGTPTAPGYTVSWNGSALSTSLALETGDYKFYGYAPVSQQDDASFDNSNKTLTIRNIPGLSDKDMMVIKPCSTKVVPDDISNGKTVSLQMDHMMAKITPYFYINSEYNKLRDIHIKNVTFSLENRKTFQANVVYNDNYTSYLTSWQINENLNEKTVELFTDDSNTKTFLTTSSTGAQPYGQCYIVPSQNGQDITNLKMTVTYDVYDKKQQLVRSDETATNKVVVKVGGTTKTQLEAGNNYKLNIQIIPTYLYVLSDNDESSVLVIPNN